MQTTINVSKDTHVSSRDTTPEEVDSNFGGASELELSTFKSSRGNPYNKRIFLEFDIGVAPSSDTISSVILQLKVHTGYEPADAYFQRLTDQFSEFGLTWNNQDDVSFETLNEARHLIDGDAAIGSIQSYDITEIYKDAKDAGGFLGVRIRYVEEDYRSFPIRMWFEAQSKWAPRIVIEHAEPPTITDLSWSPKGEYKVLSAGASLVGATEQLKVITLNYTDNPDLIDEGEAYLERLDLEGNSLEVFAVAEYDHFRFDNEEWWALNIICGPECDIVTFANETAEALKTPKIGDEIQFTCNIDWHGVDPDRVEWYYAKAPNRCFDAEEAAGLWERFAETQLPTHTFEADDDHEIVFLKVVAKNANGDIGELGDTCRPIFNLWKPSPPGFLESWLIAPFMAYILPALAEKFEHICDLVFDGVPESSGGGFSLLWASVAFVMWIAEELAEVAEDILDLVFGIPAAESTGGFSIFWSAANFVQWIYRSVAAMFEDILDLVFAD